MVELMQKNVERESLAPDSASSPQELFQIVVGIAKKSDEKVLRSWPAGWLS